MADQKIAYADSTLAVTSYASLATDAFACSAKFDNSSNLYIDAAVHLALKSGTSWVGTDIVNIYLLAQYSSTSSDVTAGIGTSMSISDAVKTDATNFQKAMLPNSYPVIWTAGNTVQHAGPISVAGTFGYMPEYFGVLIENTSGTVTLDSSGHACKVTAYYYTSS